ncbi:N/A [soil metagenome]
MNGNCSKYLNWRSVLLALTLFLVPTMADAQTTGRIMGTVAGQDGSALHGVEVSVVGTRLGTLTNAGGQFMIAGVPAGTQQLRLSYIGFRDIVELIDVRAGDVVQVSIRLEGAPVELGGVVVSAARRAQRITDAPATITRIDAEVIANSPGASFAAALKNVKGLDFIQTGMTTAAINARGFNSSFNNRMLMMEDGRIAVLPENGLPVGQFTAIPKIDLAGIEVLVGPGAALYGADASSGVVTLQTKDPRLFPGTSIEVTGGARGAQPDFDGNDSRRYFDLQMRHAGMFGNIGYKVAGEYQDANEWQNLLTYNIALSPTNIVPIREDGLGVNSVDFRSRVFRGIGSVIHYQGDNQLEFSAGASESDGVGQTNVGRNQLRGWGYNFAQAKYTTPRLYFNMYRTQSTSGESFAINRYADAQVRNPGLSPDSLRRLSDWPSNGRMYAAEFQNNFRVPSILNTYFVWGAQYRQDIVSSDRQWLTDRLTGSDLSIRQYGVYSQAEAPLTPWLNLIFAARYDDHENYDAQFSPKAGVVLKPAANQAVRLTYNRAFKSPSTLQTNFFIPDWTAVIAIFGNTEGYSVHSNPAGTGTAVATYDPLRPEENTTWEAGYKGVLNNRLFIDVAGYHSRYQHFLSPLAVISNPYARTAEGQPAPTFAFDAQGRALDNNKLVLTYFNLGRATLYGTDAGLNYYVSPRVSLNGTFSWLKLDDVEVPAGREEATAINSPNTKWTLGSRFTDFGNLQGGANLRHVNSYYFRSGINMGVIPTFTTLDLNLGYRIQPYNTTLTVGVNNLFGCSQNEDQPLQYDSADRLRTAPTNRSRECGFNTKHQEMINMPAIGTMVFIGARYHIQ